MTSQEFCKALRAFVAELVEPETHGVQPPRATGASEPRAQVAQPLGPERVVGYVERLEQRTVQQRLCEALGAVSAHVTVGEGEGGESWQQRGYVRTRDGVMRA